MILQQMRVTRLAILFTCLNIQCLRLVATYLQRALKALFSFSLMACLLSPVLCAQANAQPLNRYPGLVFSLTEIPPTPNSTPSLETEEIKPSTTHEQELGILREQLGPFDLGYLPTLTNLGQSYQSELEHASALEALEQTLQITRIHHGLNSTQQLPIINSLLDNTLALDDYDGADDLQALKLHISQNSFAPGSDALSAALTEAAEWHIDYFTTNYLYLHQPTFFQRSARFATSEAYRETHFGDITAFFSDSQAGITANSQSGITSIRSSRFLSSNSKRLNEAEAHYDDIIESFYSPGQGTASPQLLEALLQQASIAWYRNEELNLYKNYLPLPDNHIITHQDAQRMVSDHYRTGREALALRLQLIEDSPNSDYTDIVNAMLDLADWYLIFDSTRQSRALYRDIYQFLKEEGLNEEAIEAIVMPQTPLKLPVYVVHKYQTNSLHPFDTPAPSEKGFVEITMDINIFGKARNIRSAEYSENVGTRLRNILRNSIQDATFRPSMLEGEIEKQNDMSLRYYFQH